MDQLRFDGRVAAITGAHHGLGREYALLLARRGARVVVNDIQGAEETLSIIKAEGGEAIENRSDVSHAEGTDQIVEDALNAWNRIDIVVNNAAAGPIATLGEEGGVRSTMDVHYFGTQNLVRSAMPVLLAQEYGRIINTSSGSVLGIPGTGAYAAGKGAVLAFSRVLARELEMETAIDIKVNVLMPAAQTPNFPPVPDKRIQSILETAFAPAQVSPALAVLAHESCPVSGEVLQVGGSSVSRVLLATTEGWRAPDGQLTPENVLAHWPEVMANQDLCEPVGSMSDLFARRGEYPYTAIDIYRWGSTGEPPIGDR